MQLTITENGETRHVEGVEELDFQVTDTSLCLRIIHRETLRCESFLLKQEHGDSFSAREDI